MPNRCHLAAAGSEVEDYQSELVESVAPSEFPELVVEEQLQQAEGLERHALCMNLCAAELCLAKCSISLSRNQFPDL